MIKPIVASTFLVLTSLALLTQCKSLSGVSSKETALNPPTAFIENDNDFAFRVLADGIVTDLMKKHNIQAASLSYLVGWEQYVNKSYQLSENDLAIDSTSIFQAGELSKPLAVLSVMSLVKENHFDLNRDIRGDLKLWGIKNNYEETFLSLRNVLKNRGGFNFTSIDAYSLEEEKPSLEQLIQGKNPAKNKALQLTNEPIKNFHPNDGGYLVVQKLIEQTMRESFESLCKVYVLGYLEMNSSSILNPLDDSRVVPGYSIKNKKNDQYSIYPSSAAKGLWSTSYDLSKLLNHLVWSVEGKSSIMDEEAAKDVLENQLGIKYHPKFQSISYYGMTDGYTAHISASLRDKIGLSIMTNSSNGGAFIDELYLYLNRTVPSIDE
tara:strand:+ start:22607 stop:23743 length:1137 start_codon:yes stop_codon:yes gene_type:complete